MARERLAFGLMLAGHAALAVLFLQLARLPTHGPETDWLRFPIPWAISPDLDEDGWWSRKVINQVLPIAAGLITAALPPAVVGWLFRRRPVLDRGAVRGLWAVVFAAVCGFAVAWGTAVAGEYVSLKQTATRLGFGAMMVDGAAEADRRLVRWRHAHPFPVTFTTYSVATLFGVLAGGVLGCVVLRPWRCPAGVASGAVEGRGAGGAHGASGPGV